MREFEDAIYTLLTDDATLMAMLPGGVWRIQAAQGTVLPYVWMHPQSNWQMVEAFAGRACRTRLYTIRGVVDCGSNGGLPTVCYDIDERLDTLLENAAPTLANGHSIMYLRREQGFDLREFDPNGTTYQHLGGIYRAYVS